MVPRNSLPPPPRPDLFRDVSAHSKASVPSSSQSNEADDEQSASERSSSSFIMDPRPPPTYEGEDTRLTSNKELAGFYMYGWAAEVVLVAHCNYSKY